MELSSVAIVVISIQLSCFIMKLSVGILMSFSLVYGGLQNVYTHIIILYLNLLLMCFNMDRKSRALNLAVFMLTYCTVRNSKIATPTICQK